MKMYRSLTELIGHTPLLVLTGYCRENGLNATIAAKLEADIRKNFDKLMGNQSRIAAAKAAGRAVDVSADDFKDED